MSGLSPAFSLRSGSPNPWGSKTKALARASVTERNDEIPTPEFRQMSRTALPELRWENATVILGQVSHKRRQLPEFSQYQLQAQTLVPLHQAPASPLGISSNHNRSHRQIMKQNMPPQLHSHGRSIGF